MIFFSLFQIENHLFRYFSSSSKNTLILPLCASSISFIKRLFYWALQTSSFSFATSLILCRIFSSCGPILSSFVYSWQVFYTFTCRCFLKLSDTIGNPLYFQLFHLNLKPELWLILWNLLFSSSSHLMVESKRMLSLVTRSKRKETRLLPEDDIEGLCFIVWYSVDPVSPKFLWDLLRECEVWCIVFYYRRAKR